MHKTIWIAFLSAALAVLIGGAAWAENADNGAPLSGGAVGGLLEPPVAAPATPDPRSATPPAPTITCLALPSEVKVRHSRFLPGDKLRFTSSTTEIRAQPTMESPPIGFYRLSQTSWPDRDQTAATDICGPDWVKLTTPYDHGNQSYLTGWVNTANLRNLEPDFIHAKSSAPAK